MDQGYGSDTEKGADPGKKYFVQADSRRAFGRSFHFKDKIHAGFLFLRNFYGAG